MPTLHVRNVPDELYERLRLRARNQGRSMTAEVVHLLQSALEENARSQEDILAGIRRRRFYHPAAANAPTSLHLLREDRAK